MPNSQNIPEITLAEAQKIITAVADSQSVMLLSAPGVGKTVAVKDAAAAAGLECKSLLGTQIAPEDVSGVPKIIGERSVFCPPRVLLPENTDKPFCLFLDELPACSPDVQKAFYSLLLDRRIGEYNLPKGSWVVAAGNRVEDHALVRNTSSALINRILVLQIKVSVVEWLNYARRNGARKDILSYILYRPKGLQREVPMTSVPFSTPRSWMSLSKTLDKLEAAGVLNDNVLRATVFGMLSPDDVAIYMSFVNYKIQLEHPLKTYIKNPNLLPETNDPASLATRYFILKNIRMCAQNDGCTTPEGKPQMAEFLDLHNDVTSKELDKFIGQLRLEDRIVLLLDLVAKWAELGVSTSLSMTLKEITGVGIDL